MKRYPKYKDSEIDWIQCLPEHWTTVTLRNLLKERIELNKPEKTRELLALSYALGVTLYRDKKYNMDRVKEDFTQYKIVHENDFVLSPNDIIKGSAYVSKYYGCISPMYLIFESRSKDFTELNFLSYFVRSQVAGRKFFSLAKGLIGSILDNGKYVTRRMSVSRNDILSFKIALPPHDEQEAIVEFLETKTSKIDAYVAERERELAALEELRQAEIASVVTRGLNPDAPMRDSGIPWLGKIPAHWKLRKMKFSFSERSEKNHPDETKLSATQSHGVIPQSMYEDKGNHVVDVNKNFEGLKLVKVGDFVIHLRSFQGGLAYAHYQGIISAAYTILTPIEPEFAQYYRLLFMSFPYIQLLKTCVTGIREGQNIDYGVLGNKYIPIPPIEEQNAIVEYIEQKTAKIDGLIADLTEQIEKLKEYKQRLIADAVTGQIDVRPNN